MSQMGPYYVWKMLNLRGEAMSPRQVAAAHATLPEARVTKWAQDRVEIALDILDRYGLAEEQDDGRWKHRPFAVDRDSRLSLTKTMAKEWRARRPTMPTSPPDKRLSRARQSKR